MTRKILVTAFIISFFAVLSASTSVFAQSSPTIKVTGPKSVKAGSVGTFTIKFNHGPKVKIPNEPPIEITINTDGITGQGEPSFTSDAEGYINNSKITYKFKVSSDAQSGSTISVSGRVKFGYCSTETGVCKFGDQPFTVNVKIK